MPGIDSNTKLMLHMNSDFSDSSSSNHTPTVNGATIDTGIKKFGAGSGKFVRASSQLVSYPDSDDWFLGTGKFTIDAQIRLLSLPSVGQLYVIVVQRRTPSTGSGFYFALRNNGGTQQLTFLGYNSSNNIIINVTESITMSIGAFYHLAIVRDGNNFKLFQEGAQLGSDTVDTDTIADWTGTLTIGAWNASNDFMNGYIDELRFSKGVARWTSNFTPPTEEYTDDGAPPSGVTIFRRRIEGE
jgi:hypothetical protein